APEKLTVSGALPLVGTPAATATGGVFPPEGLTTSVRIDALFVSLFSNTAPSESAASRNGTCPTVASVASADKATLPRAGTVTSPCASTAVPARNTQCERG